MMMTRILILAIACIGISPILSQGRAEGPENLQRSLSEIVYVPAYSHVHTQQRTRQPLASTLVVHNVDPSTGITLHRVAYYDNAGTLLKEFLGEPVILGPFASKSFLTAISEDAGGIGANYIVEWRSDAPVLSPIVEAVMIGGSGTQGISFVSRGRVIQQTPARTGAD